MNNSQLILATTIVFILAGCTSDKNRTKTITGSSNLVKATAPDAVEEYVQGYALPEFDDGKIQSPINVLNCDTVNLHRHNVMLHYRQSSEKIVNMGHTIQIEYQAGSTVEYDGHAYELKQFHFHTPSEHLVDGITYPMEMHMVHQRKEKDSTALTDYLVIGVWFKETKADNPFINEFLDAVPDQEGGVNEVKGGSVDVNDLFKQAPSLEYYHYNGSLTTPPYSESVTWLIVKHIFEASSRQIERLNRLEGNNARHVHTTFKRVVDVID
jgi:carbonic anhydrase